MRGKEAFLSSKWKPSGITPAYAGKSFTSLLSSTVPEDHPRLCGEKLSEMTDVDLNMGSPPPMRGKANIEYQHQHVNRITPAYAGKSGKNLHQLTGTKDHPRLCGEKVVLRWIRAVD